MKVLVLTHRLPYAPNRGDRIRAFHIIRTLAAHADVRVVSLVHDGDEQREVVTLRRLGVRVWTARVSRARNLWRACGALATRTPLTHALLGAPGAAAAIEHAVSDGLPDLVIAYCSGIAPLALAPPLDRVPLILDLVDVDSEKWAEYARRASPPRSWIFAREARCLSLFEARAAGQAHMTTVVNEREREALRRICPNARVLVVPNGVDVEALAPPGPPAADPRVIFTGVFNYAPNLDGALWLAREVWPLIRQRIPSARLTLAGSHPPRALQRLAAVDSSIDVTGRVPDMRPYLWRAAVAVAPIFTARGVQNKVLEAVAAGLPAVVTSAVLHGLPPQVLPACVEADTARAFATRVVDLLLQTPVQRRARASRAAIRELGWPQRLAPLAGLIEDVVSPVRGRRALSL